MSGNLPRSPGRRHAARSGPSVAPPAHRTRGRHRFLEWDTYRVEREWRRYEGTPLRDLYRELRERFLERHRPTGPGRSLEIGPGPGRFTSRLGSGEDHVVLLEISRSMLDRVRADVSPDVQGRLDLVQGDAVDPPFRGGRFQQVVMMGNVLGFAEEDAPELLSRAVALVAPSGQLILEFIAGPGERSRYLHRLPPGAIARLLAAPLQAIQPRVEREGFDRVPDRGKAEHRFRRFAPDEIRTRLEAAGLRVRDLLAVAPCLGNDPSRLTVVRTVPGAWVHLLELEEAVGRAAERQRHAAALLLAAGRPAE